MELKPCPFCGGNAIATYDPDGVVDSCERKWAWTIVCERCCATSGLTFLKKKAIAAWNNRVGDDLTERMEDDGK